MPFPFEISATEGRARTGVLKTARGDIRTPAFMPVGTAATVKAMTVDQVKATGADIILGNTYHLMLRPGPERMERLGGLHKFMGWDKPILTDSGGFQVMSLAGISKVKEEAVTFSSHIDGSKHVLTPERSIEIQADRIGADISMQLDQCVAYPAEKDAARKAMELSIRWGAALQGPVRRARKPGPVRHPAGLDLRGPAPPVVGPAARDRFRRLRHRRSGRGRRPPGHVRGAGLRARNAAADRPRYLMGRGQADRPGRGGVSRRGHVRLRPADPRRPPRPGLDLGWPAEPEERPLRRGPGPARPGHRRPVVAVFRRPICTT
jgi:hypothetical protein